MVKSSITLFLVKRFGVVVDNQNAIGALDSSKAD
jgi:predicted phage gp36 major capsid-like protein